MSTLSNYRTRLTNSLADTTAKYTNDILDEALRKVLNEYTRAFPLILDTSITLAGAGRTQSLASCTNLISVVLLLHPYDVALTDPFIRKREDYLLTWTTGGPQIFFSGQPIPKTGEKIFVRYAAKQLINGLDSAVSTTVRDDHEDLLVVGAAGQAAMMRASGLNEQWGARPNDYSQLMLWGKQQYERFLEFLAEIRSEQPLDIFPDTYWKLDKWDKQ